MSSVCLYFQVHQPYRLRRYSVFDSTSSYFDDEANARILKRVADRCYRPATTLLLELLRRHAGQFHVAFSITGTALEQLEQHAPDVVQLFQQLAATGQVEFLAETYHHSLAFLYSRDEFRAQVDLHRQAMHRLFGLDPQVFRNTELIYNNDLAAEAAALRFRAVLTEGWNEVLGDRSPDQLYRAAHLPNLKLLLRNYQLSDDISFRFARTDLPDWPPTPEKFAAKLAARKAPAPLCNLFMDFETFGEHQHEPTGIFKFLEQLPAVLLAAGHTFKTPSQTIASETSAEPLDVPNTISWADSTRDLSAWLGNAMQTHAMKELFRLEEPIKNCSDPQLLDDFRKLTTSDHVYYMSTKHYADGQVHSYFNPYDSPYDAYINLMNVMDNLRSRIQA